MDFFGGGPVQHLPSNVSNTNTCPKMLPTWEVILKSKVLLKNVEILQKSTQIMCGMFQQYYWSLLYHILYYVWFCDTQITKSWNDLLYAVIVLKFQRSFSMFGRIAFTRTNNHKSFCRKYWAFTIGSFNIWRHTAVIIRYSVHVLQPGKSIYDLGQMC